MIFLDTDIFVIDKMFKSSDSKDIVIGTFCKTCLGFKSCIGCAIYD